MKQSRRLALLTAVVIGPCALPAMAAEERGVAVPFGDRVVEVHARGAATNFNGAEFNLPGNVVIADQFNNRVIEVDPNGNIVWQFGDGSSTAGPTSVVAPNDEERVGSLTLLSGTGAPAGAEPTCPDGCADNRVMFVNPQGKIVWQYGQAGVTGAGPDQLNTPVCAVYLPAVSHVLIADQGNQRIIEVTKSKKIVWQYGTTGVAGIGADQLNNPNSAELLANGHILIADENNNRVIEVDRQMNIVWQYPATLDPSLLSGAAFASRLPDGNTLITDSNNNRVIEVTPDGTATTIYASPNCGTPALPTRAVRLSNGDTLISDQFNQIVVDIDSGGAVVRTIGTLCTAGSGPNQLNGPYDAKVVGDYTGLTPP